MYATYMYLGKHHAWYIQCFSTKHSIFSIQVPALPPQTPYRHKRSQPRPRSLHQSLKAQTQLRLQHRGLQAWSQHRHQSLLHKLYLLHSQSQNKALLRYWSQIKDVYLGRIGFVLWFCKKVKLLGRKISPRAHFYWTHAHSVHIANC
jgi:hypothetical protein